MSDIPAAPATLPYVVVPVVKGPAPIPSHDGAPVGDAAIKFIASAEGFGDAVGVRQGRVKSKGHPYLCPRGVPTIGYGATFYPDTGKPVTMADPPITEAQGVMMLRAHVAKFAADVDRLVHVSLSVGERGALVSFAFNIGAGALEGSTLLRKLNRGDRAGAAEQFARWNKAGLNVLPGLVVRRAAETAMFRS